MIGLDTNVLIRYLVRDDQRQYERASRLLRRAVVSPVPHIYAEVDLQRKAEILEHSTALHTTQPKHKHWRGNPSLISFLRSL